MAGLMVVLITLSIVISLSSTSDPTHVHRFLLYSYSNSPNVLRAVTEEASIEVLGSWRKTSLTVLIIPHEDDSLTSALGTAVDWWGRAIHTFTALYGYEYLNELKLTKFVQGLNGSSGDISIRYVPSLGGRICGVTNLVVTRGEILDADVRVSLECISGRVDLARLVAAHELAHALGLGHTDEPDDLMYQYVVLGARPSTLNLYALAKIYEWVERGVFRPPPSRVSLPHDIDNMYLLDAEGNPIRLRIRVYRDLEGQTQLVRTYLLSPGSSISLSADPIIYPEGVADSRYVFTGWLTNGGRELLGNSTEIMVRPKGHTDYVASYATEFRIVVKTLPGEMVERWSRRGERISLNATELYYLSDWERLRFSGWRGNVNTTERDLHIVVDGPVLLEALYVKEYRLEIETAFGRPVGDGWWREGSEVLVTVDPDMLSIGNGTRLVLFGFTGDFESSGGSILLNISRPLRIEVVWVREYNVRVFSDGVLISDLWAPEGGVLTVTTPKELDYGNRTKAVFKGWKGGAQGSESQLNITVYSPLILEAIYERLYLVQVESEVDIGEPGGWYRPGDEVSVSSPSVIELGDGLRAVFKGITGSVSSMEPAVKIIVTEPLLLKWNWRVEARILIRNNMLGDVGTIWVPLGQTILLQAPSIIIIDDEEALEFVSWVAGDEFNGAVLLLEVKGPLEITQHYRRIYKVVFRTHPEVDVSILLRTQTGLSVSTGPDAELWLAEGDINIERIEWRGEDVKISEVVRVNAPGEYVLPLPIRSLSLRVVDYLGLPAPLYTVKASRSSGLEEAVDETDMLGYARLKTISNHASLITIEWGPFRTQNPISAGLSEVRAPLSPYSLLIIVALAGASALYQVRRHRVRERGAAYSISS
jgi:hypothetical protein